MTFLQIDDNFIASYQASYGIATSFDDLPPEPGTSKQQLQQGQTASTTSSAAAGGKAAGGSKEENKEVREIVKCQ